VISRLLDPLCVLALVLGVGLVLGSAPALRDPRRRVRYAIRAAWSAWLALFVLSTPRCSTTLADWVEPDPVDVAARVADTPVAKRVLVVLGSGFRDTAVPLPAAERLTSNGIVRLAGAARLFREVGFGEVIVSGRASEHQPRELAESMAAVLVDFGVPRERIILEPWSRTTRENASYSTLIIEQLDVDRVVVVSDALHVPRGLLEFERSGVDAIGAPVAHEGRPAVGLDAFLPSSGGLLLSHRVIHEVLGRYKPAWADPPERWGGGPPPDYDPRAPLRP
jgi:uncharacterized SAM-binding protein YcdF (DUF218 family)